MLAFSALKSTDKYNNIQHHLQQIFMAYKTDWHPIIQWHNGNSLGEVETALFLAISHYTLSS